MRYVLFLLIGIIVGAGVAYMFQPKEQVKTVSTKEKTYPQFSVISPPPDSLSGTVEHEGELMYEPRGATQPASFNNVTTVHQAERLITQSRGATITFPSMTLVMKPQSDITFIQTLPVDTVIQQRTGTVTYRTKNSPLSIRIRNALVTLNNGEMDIAMEDGVSEITIETTKGTPSIAFNDTDTRSQVFSLREGQVYEYNSDERTAVNTANQ